MTHKIWRTVGGAGVRASHMAANNQKVKIDEKFRIGTDRLFLPADPSASFDETANCRCGVRFIRDADAQIRQSNSVTFKLKRRSIHIPGELMTPLLNITRDFYRRTGKIITITSGPRNPMMQATEMYDDRTGPTYFRRLYVDDLADEIEKAHQQAKTTGGTRNDIINAMTRTIEAQIARGRYISRHLIGRGIDIRSSDMTSEEQTIFQEVAKKYAKILRESDHWHLEF